ncbi:MAG: isoprenylcysteine carboxylmethyltransferase family protein [Ignavibacteria bacterium]|jgi:protein-S-isoprenylcysteine O-methyltransferase Ste14
MDPINIIVGINLFVTISANYGGAKKGIKTSLTKAIKKPKTYLQKIPPNISALILIAQVLAIFNIGTFGSGLIENEMLFRITGLILFIIFSWNQVWSYKYLKENYAQEIVILKGHQLITKGPYGIIRHPQYVSQILSDLGVGAALMGYVIIPLVLLVEFPLFFLRAKKEEEIFSEHFKEQFLQYKKKTGFFIPFIG